MTSCVSSLSQRMIRRPSVVTGINNRGRERTHLSAITPHLNLDAFWLDRQHISSNRLPRDDMVVSICHRIGSPLVPPAVPIGSIIKFRARICDSARLLASDYII